jgi:pimeloyl-ACP methyl ester carboxylesterase
MAQYQGPVGKITSGYGADGNIKLTVQSLTNDHWANNNIIVFYPQGTSSPIPTIFFSHSYGANDTTFQIELLRHMASKRYAVVFVPYKTVGVGLTIDERYYTLYDGFVKAARTFTNIIDTNKVGFYGHSFGGGATPATAYKAFKLHNWGNKARFIFCSAPWYSYQLGDTALSDFPKDCKMITLLYNDDIVNDHKMGIDVFNHISINDSIKDCLMAYSTTINGYTYEADHNLPSQHAPKAEYDALDYYAPFRLFDALAEYTFTGSLVAKNVALGNGSAVQLNMGGQLPNLTETDHPVSEYPDAKYQFPCDSVINERISYCQSILGVSNPNENSNVRLYPNPTSTHLFIDISEVYESFTVNVYNQLGVKVLQFTDQLNIDLTPLSTGMYWVGIDINNRIITKVIQKVP